jgi:trimeric autotransporter adhesin
MDQATMKTRIQNLLMALAVFSTINTQLSTVRAQDTAFTYQGQLQNNGSPAKGSYNLQFTLFNSTNANAIAAAGPVTNNSVNVTNGLFTVLIDFGAGAFTGQTNWLQIGVASNGVNTFTTLNPLQPLTPVPCSIFANSASNLLGTLPAGQLAGTVSLAQLPDAVITNNSQTTVTLSNVTLNGVLNFSSAASEINGNGNSLLYSSSAYYGNFFAGLNAGNPANDSGAGNTANGFEALQDNTSGNDNTANGNDALYNNLSGSYNTASGDEALYNNINGSFNTANGINALYNNLSGGYNTANSLDALFYNTNGSDNTANGAGTLFNNTSGSDNTADGSYALNNVVTGTNDIALGYYAGSAFNAGESSNIDLGNSGITGDSGIIRIGTAGAQTQAYIAGTIFGNGAGLTNLNASQLSSGMIPLAQLPLPVVTNTEINVTLNGAFNGNGGGLTNLNAAQLTGSGTLALSVLPASVVTNSETGVTLTGTFHGNGGGLTNLNAVTLGGSQLSLAASGIQLGTNFNAVVHPILLKAAGDINHGVGYATSVTNFTAFNPPDGPILWGYGGGALGSMNTGARLGLVWTPTGVGIGTNAPASALQVVGTITATSFSGNGAGLTNLNAAQLTGSGTFNGNGSGLTGLNASQLNGETATSGDAANTIVSRDSSGDFSAGSVTLNGSLNLPSPVNIYDDSGSTHLLYSAGQNFFAGDSAGNWAASGSDNAAIGFSALTSDTSGEENTAIGSEALFYNTSGYANTAIGDAALLQNTTASGNTALGFWALFSLTNGSGNIALGDSAGYNLTSANNTIEIGNAGGTSDNNVIRIGNGQTATYLAGTVYGNNLAYTSDRNAKENFTALNPQEVLEKVASLPVTEWNYKTAKNLEHIGPMAQDFHAAFGLNGEDDKHISVVDEDGVALAAIQGLNQKLEEQWVENAKLKQQNESLEKRLDELEQTVQSLAEKK